MDNWQVIITTRCLNTNITQDQITLEVLTTDSTAARRVAMQRLYRDKHIAELEAENSRRQAERQKGMDYSIALQKIIESLCEGRPITPEIHKLAPYHARMAAALTEGDM